MVRWIIIALIFCIGFLTGCTPGITTPQQASPVVVPSPTQPPIPQTIASLVPQPSATATRATLRVDASVPDGLRAQIHLPEGVRLAQKGEIPDLALTALTDVERAPVETTQIYALVAPFATLTDGVRFSDLRRAWQGRASGEFSSTQLMVSASTLEAFVTLWGDPADGTVQVVEADDLLETAWEDGPAFAIVPFDELTPRWKVLAIDGTSPLEKGLDVHRYPLAVRFGLQGETSFALPASNWNPEAMTVLAMTGVTALVRQIAERMEGQGVLYPAEEIGALLQSADLTHISNEVPFVVDCPAPERRDPNFCSPPGYLALLEAVGTDIVELTGNHVLDWGAQPFLDTLEMYAQAGWGVFGGGVDAETARAALLVEDHGNRLAFVGCNAAGPQSAWAGEDTPGAARCDYAWLAGEIARLKQAGYVVIATQQHVEVCQFEPHLTQKADFGKLANAGADVVSGSQAHCPQAMAFEGDQFIHYGLGNLFFDQMDEKARRQMIDRIVVYNNKVISVQLVTTMLEDYSQPRLMTEKERRKLLEDSFRASGWMD